VGELPFNTGDTLLGFLNRVERSFHAGLPTQESSSFAFQSDAKLLDTGLVVLVRLHSNRANDAPSWGRHALANRAPRLSREAGHHVMHAGRGLDGRLGAQTEPPSAEGYAAGLDCGGTR